MNGDLVQMLSGLTEEQRSYCIQRYSQKEKSIGIAYILYFFLGAHYFYLRKHVLNIIYWLTLGGIGIWGLINLFTIPSLVRNANTLILEELVTEAKALYPVAENSTEQIQALYPASDIIYKENNQAEEK